MKEIYLLKLLRYYSICALVQVHWKKKFEVYVCVCVIWTNKSLKHN